jgi:flagellin
MTRINTNVSSLVAQNTLGRSNAALNQALTRLSTGLRINTGKDDPAGLIASENLRSDITSIRKAITNTDRANQVIATADSALGQVSSLLNDIRGLVTESANTGALSDDQIAANQLQVDSSLEALNRIAQTTTFQGRRLLDGSLDFLTTAGTNFSRLSNLQIDQANLGATGSVNVDITVSTAATRAQVDITNIPTAVAAVSASGDLTFTDTVRQASGTINLDGIAATQSSGTVTLTNSVGTAAVQATGGVITYGNGVGGANDGTLSIAAVAGGAADGIEGNQLATITLAFSGAAGAVYNATSNTLAVTVTTADGATSVGDIVTAIDLGGDFDAAALTEVATVQEAASGATVTTPLTGGVDFIPATFSLSADVGGLADGVVGDSVDVIINDNNTGDIAVFNAIANTLTVTVDATGGATVDDVVNAINNFEGANFTANSTFGAATVAVADATTYADPLTGGANAVLASFSLSADALGQADGAAGNGVQLRIIDNNTGDTASYDAVNNILSVTLDISGAGADVTDLIGAINTNVGADFTATTSTGSAAVQATDVLPNPYTNILTNGQDAGADVITITSDTTGAAANNVVVSIVEASGVGTTPTAAFNGANIQVTVDNTATTTLSDIANAIDGLAGYSATVSAPGGNAEYIGSLDSAPTAATLTGGITGSGGLAGAVVLELAGRNGAEVLSFEAGTSISQLEAGINLLQDATGLTATINGTTLELVSNTYGSKAIVGVNVISEGSGSTPSGAFTTAIGQGTRVEGTNSVATINGVSASADGNVLAINTATLDLQTTVQAETTGTSSFTITGGGALFQLGPDVVTNQQARLGIGSVNTAQLGGLSGKLFSLGSGGTATLAADPTTAASIVEEAINQVTSLRGRLGAFQRTSLETNRNALGDTLVNLTDAESAIRDADFAAETAALTRAQILVQSGTTVLQITNQNPQNVLALLR